MYNKSKRKEEEKWAKSKIQQLKTHLATGMKKK